MTVFGKASIAELEKAGAFENLKILPDKADIVPEEKKPFWRENFSVLISLMLIIVGYFFQFNYGEESLQAISSFFGAIAIGGYSLFKNGLKNLIKLDFDMRALMTIAIKIGRAHV